MFWLEREVQEGYVSEAILISFRYLSCLMEVIRVKVSDEMKRRMESFSDIDWSEVGREGILQRLEAEEAESVKPRPRKKSKEIKGHISHGGDAVESKRRVQKGQCRLDLGTGADEFVPPLT